MPKYTPEAIIVRTAVDEIGSLLNVDRIPGENLADYAERIFSTYVKRSSSSYEGLINGINRGLGLSEEDTLRVSLKSVIHGQQDDPNVTITQNSVQDTTQYTNTIDGSTVTATGTRLFDSTQAWEVNRLRGFKLIINSDQYTIVSNTENEVFIKDAEMSGLIGQTYTIKLNFEENELNGLALRIHNRSYRIESNTADRLFIESGDLFENTVLDYRVTAFNPKVEVTASKMYLYKEYSNEDNFQLEEEIDLRGDIKFHKDVVDRINDTEFFQAEDLQSVKADIYVSTFKKQSSEKIVTREVVPAAKFFKLANDRIKQGSVQFSEATTFLREVDQQDVSQLKGNFFVEYATGTVLVNSTPSGNGTVSYIWNEFPFTVVSSPSIVNAFVEEDIKDFLFAQIEMKFYENEKERYISGQPKADMIEYIAELLSVKPLNWGE
jgi:hypothetical protein